MGKNRVVKYLKKTVACIAATAIVLSVNPAGIPYLGETGIGTVVEAETTVVEIGTYEAFQTFAETVNAGDTQGKYASVKLTADIVIPSGTEWVPIGSAGTPYTGSFDGDGHTISGLTYTSTTMPDGEKAAFGLFGYVKDAAIKNVTVSSFSLNGAGFIGGLCGYADGAVIENCTVDKSCTITSSASLVGGLVCMVDNGTEMLNCTVAADIILTGQGPTGGFTYMLQGASVIMNSVFSGSIESTTVIAWTGGFAGIMQGADTAILNCMYTGSISGLNFSNCSTFVGGQGIGGTIRNCFSNGKITETSGTSETAGIFRGGDSAGTSIDNCIAGPLNAEYPMVTTAGNITNTERYTAEEIASGKAEYTLNHYGSTLSETDQSAYSVDKWKAFVLTESGTLKLSDTSRNIRKIVFHDAEDQVIAEEYLPQESKLIFPETVTYTTCRDSQGNMQSTDSLVGESDMMLYPFDEDAANTELNTTQISLSLSSDISIIYVLKDGVLNHYARVWAEFTDASGQSLGSTDAKVETIDGVSYTCVRYNGITAKEMAKEITVTIYGSNSDGTSVYHSEEYTNSVAGYARQLLEMDSTGNALKQLVVDMLNYGAAAQNYFGYQTSKLANDGFDAYQSYASAAYDLNNISGDKSSSHSSGTRVNFVGRTLVLKNKVGIAFILDASDYEGDIADVSVAVRDYSGNLIDTISGSELQKYGSEGNKYYGITYAITAARMQERHTFYVMIEGKETAEAYMEYSVSAYANNMKDNSNQKLIALLTELMEYSDSVKAYANGGQ